jgi:uncharacterized protein (DUF1697 family)
LKEQIAQTLREKLGGKTNVVLLTFVEIEEVIAQKPEGFGENKEVFRYDVIFLMGALKTSDAMKAFHPKEGVDTIYEGKKVVYISRLISQLTKSRFSKTNESSMYQDITIRNGNTTKKLYQIIKITDEHSRIMKRLFV